MPSKKVLLDSCVPRPLKHELKAHSVRHTSEVGWQDLDDRPLLERADKAFDVLITTDQNLRYQQNLSRYTLSIIILVAHTNRLEDLLPLVPDLLEELSEIKPGEISEVS
jgi:predicted nuclease of predicted toxin-antitoxin system